MQMATDSDITSVRSGMFHVHSKEPCQLQGPGRTEKIRWVFSTARPEIRALKAALDTGRSFVKKDNR